MEGNVTAKLEKGDRTISRREALAVGLAGAGVGVASVVGWSVARGQRPLPPSRDPNFGESPSWTTELNEVGPNCYTYVQGNGPPHSGGGISNAGFVVGADGTMVFDALVGPDDPAYGNISPTFQAQEGRALGGEPRNLVPPTTTITDTTTYYYGDTVVELIPPEVAHTWGDILVFLPEHRTLWMGAERIILNLYRFYKEFEGTLDHNLDLPGFRVATAEYNTIVGGTPEASHRIYHFDRVHG